MFPFEWLKDLPLESFSSNQELIRAGVCQEKIYFLKCGKVEVVRDGCRIALIKSPGSVLGEISVLLGIPTTATVRALEDSTLLVAHKGLDFLRDNPRILVHVSRTLASRLDAASRYLVDVKEQLQDSSDHIGIVDGVLDAIVHRDLKKKVVSSLSD